MRLWRALRASAMEFRILCMTETERTAAAAAPKLTTPKIVSFLAVLLVMVIAPAIIQMMDFGA